MSASASNNSVKPLPSRAQGTGACVFAHARTHNDASLAASDLKGWLSWARCSRLDPFKRLATTLRTHFDAVVRGMLDNRSNAFVEAMNGLMQQAKRATRGFRTATHFINIAYLRWAICLGRDF